MAPLGRGVIDEFELMLVCSRSTNQLMKGVGLPNRVRVRVCLGLTLGLGLGLGLRLGLGLGLGLR